MFVRVTVVEVEKEAAHVFVVDFPSAVGFILRDNLQTPTSNILNVYISNPLFSSGEKFMYKNHNIHSLHFQQLVVLKNHVQRFSQLLFHASFDFNPTFKSFPIQRIYLGSSHKQIPLKTVFFCFYSCQNS